MQSHNFPVRLTTRRFATLLVVACTISLTPCAPGKTSGPIARLLARRKATAAATTPPRPSLTFPIVPDSVRFAVIGDSGTGKPMQYETAGEMAACHKKFPFNFVIMLGDNIYGHKSPRDMKRKFSLPYKALLDEGVKFYASLGNHDGTNETFYKPFNMQGRRYYSFTKGNARFFALDSNYMSPAQLEWLEAQLSGTKQRWKICFFHHPLYSDGKFHGPDVDLRTRLEPLFDKYNVNVVFSGHDHVYERIKPHNGVYYFVLGNSGQLRPHGLRPAREMAAGFDTDRDFMIVEISGDTFYFETISRTGKVVDQGAIVWQKTMSQ